MNDRYSGEPVNPDHTAQERYQPVIVLEDEDEGLDKKEWLQKQSLKSQGYCSTFRFFVKQSFKDVRRHKCQFCLGFCSVFVVVLMTLIINTLIDKGPIIFLRLAEGSVGETDAIIESSANTDSSFLYYLNLTQINKLYPDEYYLSPRKVQVAQYYVSNTVSNQISKTTGLPTLPKSERDSMVFSEERQQTIRQIDTLQEKKINCGRHYKFDKLKLGE